MARSLRLAATVALVALIILALNSYARAQVLQTYNGVTILATANPWGAGRTGQAATPGGGSAATVWTLPSGTNRVLRFLDVSGTWTNGGAFHSPDGVTSGAVGAYPANQGISGIAFNGYYSFLTGVFISGPPAGYADGSSGSNAPSLLCDDTTTAQSFFTPLLNQQFYVGDGLTGHGSGTIQTFAVPDTATGLVLGMPDMANGVIGTYGDNSGSLTATFQISVASVGAPEPASIALLLPVFLGGMNLLRHRQA